MSPWVSEVPKKPPINLHIFYRILEPKVLSPKREWELFSKGKYVKTRFRFVGIQILCSFFHFCLTLLTVAVTRSLHPPYRTTVTRKVGKPLHWGKWKNFLILDTGCIRGWRKREMIWKVEQRNVERKKTKVLKIGVLGLPSLFLISDYFPSVPLLHVSSLWHLRTQQGREDCRNKTVKAIAV